ncbi:MAG TPA: hypothetical protein IAA06_00145 [Candidatus Blautia faecavium]|uniref:TrbL/VirB6 plasmid conjugal transfer protein n=1 Tax=Candidatus Blautia faecavium TaxID=2838487 RepID=A0A9D2RVX4_9FIRM|nr:hypothetical protein [Candidatus Blautia faecavium]
MLEVLTDWFSLIFNQLYSVSGAMDTFSTYNDMYYSLMNNPVFTSVAGAIMGIGVGIMLIYFLLDLAEKVQDRSFTLQHFMRSIVFMIVAYILIIYSMDLLQGFVAFGQAVANLLNESSLAEGMAFFEKGTPQYDQFKEGVSDVKLLPSIGFVIKAILPWLISTIASLIVTFLAVSRIVEMVVRCLFAPIAVSDCFRDGYRSNAIRYLKKFLAISLQYALIIGINVGMSFIIAQAVGANTGAELLTALEATNFSGEGCTEFLDSLLGGDHYLLLLGLLCTKVGLLIKSMGIANDVVGV